VPNKTVNPPQSEIEQSSQLTTIVKNGVLYKNPVLYSALGLFPVISAGLTLYDGLALSVILACMLIPCCTVASILGTRIPDAFRPPVYLLLSGGFYFLSVAVAGRLFSSELVTNLGVFAPLMVVNAIIIRRADNFAAKHIVFAAILDAVACALGFALVLCLASGVREMLTTGTLLGHHVFPRRWNIPGITLTCSGFVILGFLSAIVHALRNRREKRMERKERRRV